MGGYVSDRVTEYNPRTNTWRNMQSLQQGRRWGHIDIVCTLDNKIFVLGDSDDITCVMLDLSDDDPQWRYIAEMSSGHYDGGVVVIERKIYIVDGDGDITNVEVYDVDQGIFTNYCRG